MSSPSTAPSSKKKKAKKIKKTKSTTDTSKVSPQTPQTPLPPTTPQSPQSAPALEVPPEKTESKKKKATKRKGKKGTSAGAKEKPKETEKPSEQEKKPKKETEKQSEEKSKKVVESEKPKETKTKSVNQTGSKDTTKAKAAVNTDQVSPKETTKETKPKNVAEEQPIAKQPPKESKTYQPTDIPTKSPKPAEKKIPVDLDEEKDDHDGHVEDDSDYSLYRDLGAGATAVYTDLKNFKKNLDDEDYDELDGYGGGGSSKKAAVEVPIFQKVLKQVKFPSFDTKPGATWLADINAQEFSDIHRWQQRDIQLYYLQQTFVSQGQSIYNSLSSLLETKLQDLDLSKKTQIRVGTIGGGPLTDAVALCAYLKQQLAQIQSFDIINFDFVGDVWEKTIKEAKFVTAVQSELKELKNCEFVRFNIDESDPKEIAAFGKDNPIDVLIISELIFHTRNIFNQEFWSKLFKELSNSVFIFAEKRYLMGVFDPIEKITAIAEKTKCFTVVKHSDGMSLIGIPKKDKGEDEEDLGEEIDEAAD